MHNQLHHWMNICIRIAIKFLLLLLFISCNSLHYEKEEDEKEMEPFEWIRFGAIKPRGWMKSQMEKDLEEGFVGHLDELVPDLIVEDDIYGVDRLTCKVQAKDVGTVVSPDDWAVELLWWNSETQSNWWDGLIRHAILTENQKALERVDDYVRNKLLTQDPDGYLGIYDEDLRYKHKGENGELWAQSSLFRGLLAYYEATGEEHVLKAIERAVNRTMQAYPINNSEPFKVDKPSGGVCHGLTLTDALDRLYQLTGNPRYKDYAVFLYTDYCKHETSMEDVRVKNLLNPKYKFKEHGVHTYEHLRALAHAACYSGDSLIGKALDGYLEKLERTICPSGGPLGDEWIGGRSAHPDSTGYEYCSIHELLDSYSLLLQKSGNPHWADAMEWLLFNAGQGARHPFEHSIAYCKTDNSYHMLGALDVNRPRKEYQNRYKYSPTHQDIAVCCVPNAGRIYPYYVKAMWMHTEDGLVANLFGASEIHTIVNGGKVTITQETHYPFDFSILFAFALEEENEFEIAIRKPSWADTVVVETNAEMKEGMDYLFLKKRWKTGDQIQLRFETKPKLNIDFQQKRFVSYGPLVFALQLDAEEIEVKRYALNNFRDLHYSLTQDEKRHYQMVPEPEFQLIRSDINSDNPWGCLSLETMLFDPISQTEQAVTLQPMGGTVLRKVSFQTNTTTGKNK